MSLTALAQTPEANEITRKATAERLVKGGLAEPFDPPHGGGRSGYRLTAKGRSLLPVLSAVADWGLAHIRGTEARLRPPTAR
jgi:DNA-binding HxlR family transcriptional regulator